MLLRRIAAVADPIAAITDHIDREFSTALSSFVGVGLPTAKAFPALNMWEDDNALHLEAELPGWTMDGIEVSVHNRDLTIKGELETSRQTGEDAFLRRERFSGSFERTVRLPYPIQSDKVEASLKDGILSIMLPKAPEALPKKIAVRTN